MQQGAVPAREAVRVAPLDGVRAVAIVVVMAYHSGIPALRVGGFYGQDAFFVLSGLLITSLLLRESGRRQAIDLLAFWGRRARRLLPALLVLLLAVDLYVRYVAPPGRYPDFPATARSTLLYYANWHLLGASSNYFAGSGYPSLLTHTWSLAIEEQFYLVWPPVLLLLVRLLRRQPNRLPSAVLALSVAGALASAGWMAYLSVGGADPSRLYYGSDTHAQCLLVGAALAAGLRIAGRRRPDAALFPVARDPGRRAVLVGIGAAGAVGVCWLWTQVSSADPFAYEGGFLCVALATAAVLASVVCVPRGPLARALGWRPIAFVGQVSYGMYLWYFPAFAVLTAASTGLRAWPLFAVRSATVLGLAVISWYLVERPVQRGRLLRVDAPGWARRARPKLLTAAALVGALAVVGLPSAAATASVAPPAAPAPPLVAVGPPDRILLVGDSTALTFGIALADRSLGQTYHYVLDDRGILGCGLAVAVAVRAHGAPADTPPACNPDTPAAGRWPALLAQEVAAFRPDVVLVVAGRREVLDQQRSRGARWQDITGPAVAADIRAQLEQAVAVGGAQGARVALATAPCFSSGEQPDGSRWPEDDPARLDAYNALVGQVAAAHPGRVSVVPMDALVCPGGRYQQQIGAVTVRAPDGVHYPYFAVAQPDAPDPDTLSQTQAFGAWIAARVMPLLAPAM